VVENVRARWGTIDILVNSAGVLGAIGPTAEVSVEEWVRTVEVNLLGCFYLARAVVPVMRAQKEGVILNFSGGGAAYGRPYFTAYGASKAAVVRFTESLAEELRDCNIQVNAIAPGPVKSRMWDAVREAGDSAGVRALTELRDLEKGKWAPPERAAQLAVFLASGKCKGLSGRLVSAIYDKWETFESRVDEIMGSDALTLRRVPLK
jgi:3-oxoacyl-[acyl-carrier protein] reductase